MTDFCCDKMKDEVRKGNFSFHPEGGGVCDSRPEYDRYYSGYKCYYCRAFLINKMVKNILILANRKTSMKDYIEVEISETQKWPSLAACDRMLSIIKSKQFLYSNEAINIGDHQLLNSIIQAYKRLVNTTASHVANSIKNAD